MNKKEKQEDAIIKKGNWTLFGFIAFVLRFHTKELFAIIIIVLLGYIVAANLKCDEKGIQWIPSIKTNIEVKK
jgi:hypothetical protein